jgi:hypothetical protein
MGRPKKKASERRRDVFQIRMQTAEKRVYERAAELRGLTLAELTRRLLRKESNAAYREHGDPEPFRGL